MFVCYHYGLQHSQNILPSSYMFKKFTHMFQECHFYKTLFWRKSVFILPENLCFNFTSATAVDRSLLFVWKKFFAFPEMDTQYCVCDSCTEVTPCGVLLLMDMQMPLSAHLLPTLALAQLYFSSTPLATLSPPLPILIVKEWLCVICFVSPDQSFSCWYLFYGQLEKSEAQGVWTGVSYHIPTHFWHVSESSSVLGIFTVRIK